MPTSHKSSRRTWFIAIITGLVLVLVASALFLLPSARQRWTAPLGPALDLPTYTPAYPPPALPATPAVLTNPPITTVNVTEESQPELAAEPGMAPALTDTPAPLCGGPPLMFVLGVGVDTEDNNYTYGLGDAIRIARVDFINARVTVLSMPRDLWVEIPGISDHYGITHGKLNQSFFYGGTGMGYYDGPGGGPGLMARTLDQNFSLRPDHYGAVNMITFVRIVDAVGGLDVYLPTDVDGTADPLRRENMGYFYAGNNHFTGDEALRFSRIRKGIGDFNRADHQTLVLCALKKKLLDPAVLPKIPKIVTAFKDSVITDLSLGQISQLACLLPYIQREALIFASLPEDLFQQGMEYSPQMRKETFVLKADPEAVQEIISQFEVGTWPTQPDEPSCP